MKSFIVDIKLHVLMVVLLGILYPALLLGIAAFSGDAALGFPLKNGGKIIGYRNIGQAFTSPQYFWSRPSAIDYNASVSGGSNKATTNTDYLAEIAKRKLTLLEANPTIPEDRVPSEMLTASGSGLDPHISLESAKLQVPRVAKARGVSEADVMNIVAGAVEKPLFGLFAVTTVNVLLLNEQLNLRLKDQ